VVWLLTSARAAEFLAATAVVAVATVLYWLRSQRATPLA
jgi:hypothetical protein